MKPHYKIAFLLLFFSAVLFGQQGIEFKVKILPNNTSFQVLIRPNFSASNVAIAGGQVTLRVPSTGFAIGNITNHIGDWGSSTPSYDPNSDYTYFFLSPTGPITGINMDSGVEIPVFTFENAGACTGPMELFDNDNDPLANDPNINYTNSISLLGGGLFGEAYIGNYNAISADCGVTNPCPDGVSSIDIIDIILTSPSTCGVADGSIEIVAVASNSNGDPVPPLQYSINGFNNATWKTNPVFTGLAAGNVFEIYVRFFGGICMFHVGDFTLQAPFPGIYLGANTDVTPDCGMDNGTITISAVLADPNSGPLLYGVGTPPVYQASPTFSGLGAGLLPIWLRNDGNGCESQVATYLLQDCQNVPCSNLDLENMGSGIYQVSLTAGQTINQPNDVTENMRITLKVPTGFNLTNLSSQVTNVDFTVGTPVIAPTESPDFDYIPILLNTPNTQDIPYFANTKIPLFLFENGGDCGGDSLYLIPIDDPYLMTGADINHEISVSGVMLNDCINEGAVACEVIPSNCDVTYEIDRLPTGEFRVSVMTDNLNVSGVQAITSGMLVTIKVPTGGFEFSNLTSLISTPFTSSVIVTSPTEDPDFDYYSISQNGSTGPTNSPAYVAGQLVPFFTFENVGSCVTGDLILVDNNDATAQAVAAGNNVTIGQNITILGIGPTIPACLSSNATVECQGDPCASLSPGFQVDLACEGNSIEFTNTTTSNEAIASWEWTFGDGTPTSDIESPSHTYSNSGNFEVSLTVTTNSGCEATYSEFVTVFPSPGVPTTLEYVDCGSGVDITVPDADNITWSPETGLLPAPPTDQTTVNAHPMATTVYTVTLLSNDGCFTRTDITVVADIKPDWKDATPTAVSDCGLQDGQIEVLATHANGGTVEYSMDPNGPWTTSTVFTGLAAGDYNVFARNQDTGCTIASPFNPVTVAGPNPIVLGAPDLVHPSNCDANGSITVNATGGNAPLQYTLVGVAGPQDSNVFSGLLEGDYTIEVTNADGSCVETTNVTLISTGGEPIVIDRAFDAAVCVDALGSVSISIDQNIQSVTVTGGAFSNVEIDGQNVTFDVDPVLGANNYSVELFAAGGSCSVVDAFTVMGTAAPTASFNVSPTLCTNGDITLNYTGTASAGATFQWSAAGGGDIFFDDGNGVARVRWADAGMFDVTLVVSQNGCQVNTTNTLNITDFDPGANLVVTQPSCNLGNDGAIDLTVSGSGYTYAWNNNSDQEDLTNLMGGTYIVTISDANGCETVESATLVTPSGISISSTATPATDCIGNAADGTVTVTVAGGANFTYEISELGGGLVASGSTFSNTFTFNDLPAGAYTVVVTDGSGCTDEQPIAVSSITGGVTTSTTFTNADCTGQNGSVTVNITGGTAPFTYQYYNNNVSQPSGNVNGNMLQIGGVASGSATVVITDASGCLDVASFVIGEDPAPWANAPTLNIISEPSCSAPNGVVEILGLPNNVIPTWSHDATLIGTMATNVPTGNLIVTLTDLNLCQSTISTGVSSTDGPEVEIVEINDASCGNSDGGFVFQVNGGGSFSYEIIGTSVINGTGTANTPIAINDLEADNWIIEVTDLVNTACSNFEVAQVMGAFNIGNTNTVTTLPSQCGVEDATIEIELEDFMGMVNIITDKGNAPAQFTSTVTITDLYEGDVNITLTDPVTGCQEAILIQLDSIDEPEINMGDFALTHLTCPTDSGRIVSLVANEFFVLDQSGNTFVTPVNFAPVGNYMLQLIDGQCIAEMPIVIDGPADWSVTATITDESCEGEDGALSLLVSGGTPDYTFNWPNNESTTFEATNLSAGFYDVTITDAEGCTYLVSEPVDATDIAECENPCEDFIFFNDTIYQSLVGQVNKICLPTDLTIQQFAAFNLNLDGVPFASNIDQCSAKAAYYAYGSLLTFDSLSFRLDEWINSEQHLPNFEFSTIDELVTKMNEIDPTGNWINDTDQMIIIGGDPNTTYGSLVINHLPSNSNFSLEPNSIVVNNPSINVNDNRVHVLIATDPTNPNCADTLYINLLADGMPTPDTIYVEVEIGELQNACLELDELNGTLESLENNCVSVTNNAQWLATGTECIDIEGMDEGTDELCMVLCDDNGLCDTTYVIINVVDGSNELVFFNAISPNNDDKNEYFKIKNIEKYPENSLVIFNRWGNKVYGKKSYTNADPWRAIYKNTNLPDGSYFYILEVEIDGKMERRTGYVQVNR
ncbi:MAG: gliding motility-associated C-terminal domain-containing protein [Saprospiraceae bacterium]